MERKNDSRNTFSYYLCILISTSPFVEMPWNDCFEMDIHVQDNETPLSSSCERSSLKHRNFNEITLRLLLGNTLKKKPVIY